jgi:hypothetical protein
MSDAPFRFRGRRLRLVRTEAMASGSGTEIHVARIGDVLHSASTGTIAILLEDADGVRDRLVMSGETAEKLYQMLGNALSGARQNPAAP